MEQKKNPAAVALGRLGGKASLKKMTAEARRKRATKASKAAAKVRTSKAKGKKL